MMNEGMKEAGYHPLADMLSIANKLGQWDLCGDFARVISCMMIIFVNVQSIVKLDDVIM